MSHVVPRRLLVLIAVVCGAVAGAAYYAGTVRADVVVMARDVLVPRPLTPGDLAVRSVAEELAPANALRRVGDALGLTPRAPLLEGQVVLASTVSAEAVELRGWSIETGMRAIAIPVRVVDAIGGAIAPGARVDVLAIPVSGRAPAERTAEVLLTGAVVLDLRAESGSAYVPHEARGAGSVDRLASVVIAIAAADEARIADRLASSTFAFALLSGR